MTKKILAVGTSEEAAWLQTVSEAVRSLGEITFNTMETAFSELKSTPYDLIIIDATAIGDDMVDLVAQFHTARPCTPILVATTSPTWQRARQAFQAGAADYIRKTFNQQKLLTMCRDLIDKSSKP